MIHLFDRSHLPVSPWRNGGGETQEIIRVPPDTADFDWRISIATIADDGDFSPFPDIDRIITLLDGEVTLVSDNQLRHRLVVNQPYYFRGEERISAHLTAGTSHDFNIMARRTRFIPDAGTTRTTFSPPQEAGGVVLVLNGRWHHNQTPLAAGQGAWWENQGECFIPQSEDALLLWGTLLPTIRHGL